MNVGVALLNWNQYPDTARCLSSLRDSAFRPARILVFDNGSEDGSAERLAADFPEIELVRGGRNLGFAEGNNRAAQRLLDAGMDLIWILNNDTEVPSDCLGTLVRSLEEHPEAGAVSAKIWFMEEPKPIGYAGASFHGWLFNTRFHGLGKPDDGRYDVPGETMILTGCCLLVRAAVLERIGLFQPQFFAYAEDTDWCLRAREAGIRLRYEPRATLWHKMFGASRSDGALGRPKSSPQVEYWLSRNRFLLVRLHTRPWSLRRIVALNYHLFLRRLPRGVGLLLKSGRRAAGLGLFRGLWAGLWIQPEPGACLLRRAAAITSPGPEE